MIEKYKSVLYLSEELIKIELKKGTIEIMGDHLILDFYSHIELRGKGNISLVRFNY